MISIPLSFFAGIGGASRAGVLVKGSNYLEALAATDTVVFDKTGTMTKGVFEVNGIHHSSMDNEKLLEIAAHAELFSTHPIAGASVSESLRATASRRTGKGDAGRGRVAEVEEIGGNGVLG